MPIRRIAACAAALALAPGASAACRFVRIGRAPHLLFRARRIVVHTHRPS